MAGIPGMVITPIHRQLSLGLLRLLRASPALATAATAEAVPRVTVVKRIAAGLTRWRERRQGKAAFRRVLATPAARAELAQRRRQFLELTAPAATTVANAASRQAAGG